MPTSTPTPPCPRRPRGAAGALACLLLALPAGGCVAVVAGGAGYGAYKYARNEVAREYPAGLEPTWRATLAALAENGYPVAGDVPAGSTAAGVRVGDAWVRAEALPGGRTRVRLRLGTFETAEHRRRAGLIFEAIDRRLLGGPAPGA